MLAIDLLSCPHLFQYQSRVLAWWRTRAEPSTSIHACQLKSPKPTTHSTNHDDEPLPMWWQCVHRQTPGAPASCSVAMATWVYNSSYFPDPTVSHARPKDALETTKMRSRTFSTVLSHVRLDVSLHVDTPAMVLCASGYQIW